MKIVSCRITMSEYTYTRRLPAFSTAFPSLPMVIKPIKQHDRIMHTVSQIKPLDWNYTGFKMNVWSKNVR